MFDRNSVCSYLDDIIIILYFNILETRKIHRSCRIGTAKSKFKFNKQSKNPSLYKMLVGLKIILFWISIIRAFTDHHSFRSIWSTVLKTKVFKFTRYISVSYPLSPFLCSPFIVILILSAISETDVYYAHF